MDNLWQRKRENFVGRRLTREVTSELGLKKLISNSPGECVPKKKKEKKNLQADNAFDRQILLIVNTTQGQL